MELDIIKLVDFKQGINEMIDKYMIYLKDNTNSIDSTKKVLPLVISYYNRTKIIYENVRNCDDNNNNSDDNSDMVLSDELVLSEDNYSDIMNNRTYTSTDNEANIRKKLLGVGNENNFYSFKMNNHNWDSSTDPTIYNFDNNNDPSSDTNDNCPIIKEPKEYQPNQHIINNCKKTIKDFESLVDLEIVDDNNTVDYEEPKI